MLDLRDPDTDQADHCELEFDDTYARDEWLTRHGYSIGYVDGDERMVHATRATLRWLPTGRWCGTLRPA